MSANLSHYLPVKFANGATISRFGKSCPQCKNLVTAQAMEGYAALIQNRLYVSVGASCPRCGLQFRINCVINQDKSVKRIWAPSWLFRFWLKQVSPPVLKSAEAAQWQMTSDETPSSTSADSASEITPSESMIGRFGDHTIYSYVLLNQQIYLYDRIYRDHGTIQANELIYQGVVYRQNLTE